MTPDSRRARLQELLGIEATQGLSPSEANELDALLAAFPDEDPDAFELAAAAVHLALSPPPQEMPTALAERLHLAAVALAPRPTTARPPRARPAWLAWSGWAVAAGLAGVLVYNSWLAPRTSELSFAELRKALSGLSEALATRPKAAPGLADQRRAIRNDPAAKAVTFSGDKKAVSGNIVWSGPKQEGYLEVRGLPPIDPGAGTYQLWIVDAELKGQPPVDGGVFRVNPDGSVLVRIRAPIQVKSAVAFAITKEQEPGGVVVSQVKPEDYELVLAPQKG
jgi:hypothetical protein